MPPQVGDAAQAEVGQWTDREGDAPSGQAPDQRRIFERAVAVVDPIDFEHVHGVGDVGGGPLLARVRDQLEPRLAGGGEEAPKLRRRIALLGRVEAETGDAPVGDPGLRGAKRFESVLLGQMPQDAHDQQPR